MAEKASAPFETPLSESPDRGRNEDREWPEAVILRDYVKSTMMRRSLTLREVVRRSGGAISQGCVSEVLQGRATNLTAEKIGSLAAGLGVNEEELFRVVRGRYRAGKASSPAGIRGEAELLDILKRIATGSHSAEFAQFLRFLTKLTPSARALTMKVAWSVVAEQERESAEQQACGSPETCESYF